MVYAEVFPYIATKCIIDNGNTIFFPEDFLKKKEDVIIYISDFFDGKKTYGVKDESSEALIIKCNSDETKYIHLIENTIHS